MRASRQTHTRAHLIPLSQIFIRKDWAQDFCDKMFPSFVLSRFYAVFYLSSFFCALRCCQVTWFNYNCMWLLRCMLNKWWLLCQTAVQTIFWLNSKWTQSIRMVRIGYSLSFNFHSCNNKNLYKYSLIRSALK